MTAATVDLATRLEAVLRAALGEDTLRDELATWEAHARRERAVVTVIGEYDTGKSTLLKRLLLDEEQEVPAWLTVSARRETFEANEVPWRSIVIRDTPGLEGGDPLHDARTRAALCASDAFVVLLKPQVGLSATIEAILRGTLFSPHGLALASSSAALVIARMDEAGTDPTLDPEGYAALQARKRAELGAALRTLGVTPNGWSLHLVAADPFQLVGNRTDATSAEFDGYRTWDGMDDLRTMLEGFAELRVPLRRAARLRFLAAIAAETLPALSSASESAAIKADGHRNDAERARFAAERVRAYLSAAEAEVMGLVEDAMHDATRMGALEPSELSQHLDKRLSQALAEWERRADAALETLKTELGADFQTAARQRAQIPTLECCDPPRHADRAASGKVPAAWRMGATRFTNAVAQAIEAAHLLHLKDTLKVSRKELHQFEKLAGAEKLEKFFAKASVVKDARAVEVAKRYRLAHDAVGVALPALVALASLALEGWAATKAATERSSRREALQRQVADAASRAVHRFFHGDATAGVAGWRAAPDALLAALDEVEREQRTLAGSADAAAERVRGQVDDLDALLREAAR